MSQRADDLGRSATPPPYTDEDLESFGDDPLLDTPARKGIDSLEAEDTFGDVDDIAVTREQIEQTRAEMSETIDAIQQRLDPQLLVDQAKDAARDAALDKVQDLKSNVRQATVGKVEDAVSSVSEKVQGMVGVATDRTGDAADTGARTMNGSKQAGRSLLDTVKQHPVPAAMAGIGLGWLFVSARQDNKSQQDIYYQPAYTHQAYDQGADQNQRRDGTALPGQLAGQASDRVAQAANSTSRNVSQIGTKASSTARRSADSLGDLVQRNPLAVGAVTMGLGMLAGLAVPETEQENQMLGPAHDAVMERAGQLAQEKTQQAQNVAQEAMHTAKQEAWNQDQLPGS